MFCNNCGKEAMGGTKFCNNCGATLEGAAQAGQGNTRVFSAIPAVGKPISVYAAMGLSVLGIIFLLQKWITVPAIGLFQMYGIESKYNMFQIFDFVKKMGDISRDSTDGLTFVAILFIILTIGGIATFGLFIYKLATDHKNAVGIGKAAFGLSVLFPIIVYIVVGITNANVAKASQGLIKSILSTTSTPVWMIILGVAGSLLTAAGLKSK